MAFAACVVEHFRVEFESLPSPKGGTPVSHPQAASTVEVPADTPKPKVTNAERDNYAQELERSLLSRGIDATVRAVGKNHDALRISWAAMSCHVVFYMM